MTYDEVLAAVASWSPRPIHVGVQVDGLSALTFEGTISAAPDLPEWSGDEVALAFERSSFVSADAWGGERETNGIVVRLRGGRRIRSLLKRSDVVVVLIPVTD